MTTQLISVTHDEFDQLSQNGVLCIVIENGAAGLTVAALDYVLHNGNACLITTRAPGTAGSPVRFLQENGLPRVGDVVMYRKLPGTGFEIDGLEPTDERMRRKFAAARQEFLPKLYAH